ncbi:MAG: acetyl-CoA carboxylase biotin carboxyl carrier protein [Candidatus Omnitrophota bacterium]
MNAKEIKEMIKLMEDNNLTEFELEREGFKIRLSRAGMAVNSPQNFIVERVNSSQEHAGGYNIPQSAPAVPEVNANYQEIKAPMVGTFYRSPSPEAASFVEVGAEVEIGQVVCIIEAMKLMNEIKSEIKGKIKEILIENGDPIEFGQILFRIESK